MLRQNNLPVIQLQLLIKLASILAVEVNHLVGLALVTELLDFIGCYLMAVNGSPDGELTLYVFIAVVGTIIGAWPDSYFTAALWTLADGGVEHHLSFNCCRKQRREVFACLRTKAVKDLLLPCQEVLSLLFRDDPVTDGAADEEVTVTVILLEEVFTGIALTCHLDSSATDRASSLQITGRKCQLHLSVFDNKLTRKGLTLLVAHLEFTRLTGFQQRLHVFLGDVGSMILTEYNELAVVPSAVSVL